MERRRRTAFKRGHAGFHPEGRAPSKSKHNIHYGKLSQETKNGPAPAEWDRAKWEELMLSLLGKPGS